MSQYPQFNIRSVIRAVLLCAAGLFVLITFARSGAQVPADSVGVVTFFGKRSGTLPPGFHLMIPHVERITTVPIRRQRKLDFGIGGHGERERPEIMVGTVTDELTAQADPSPDNREAITGDRSLVLVEWSLFYRIHNAEDYLFNAAYPEGTLRAIADTAMHEVLGDSPASWALSSGRSTIEATVLSRIKELLAEAADQKNSVGDIGLDPTSVQILNITVPPQVALAFAKVSQAQQESAAKITNATGRARTKVALAQGEADSLTNTATGEASRILSEAEGATTRFTALYQEYRQNPPAYRTRLTYEAWAKVAQDAKTLILWTGEGAPLPTMPLVIPTPQKP